MRKLGLILALSVGVSSSAMAVGTVRDNCGCGLGTMALGDLEPTLLVQIGATILNGICGNQTFGITSGTLECEPPAGVAANPEIQRFVSDNMDHLAMDMAAGQGDALEALADLMEVSVEDRPALFAELQASFDRVFTTATISAPAMLQNLDVVLQG